jgi:hypothetical protein
MEAVASIIHWQQVTFTAACFVMFSTDVSNHFFVIRALKTRDKCKHGVTFWSVQVFCKKITLECLFAR